MGWNQGCWRNLGESEAGKGGEAQWISDWLSLEFVQYGFWERFSNKGLEDYCNCATLQEDNVKELLEH